MSEKKLLVDLVSEIEEALETRGQTKNAVAQYHYIFRVFMAYSKACGEEKYSKEILEKCLKEHYKVESPSEVLSRREHYKKKAIRSFRMLCDYAEGKPFANRYSDRQPLISSEEFIQAAIEYYSHLEKSEYTEKSISFHSQNLERFFNFLEEQRVYHFSELTVVLVNQYVQSLLEYKKTSIKGMLSSLRVVCKFFYLNGYTSANIGELIETVKTRAQTKIPSVWKRENVVRLLDAVDRGNPSGKRDYAILLLVTRLGIRVGDINCLKFENIDWQKNQISFIQSKTNHPAVLPLLKDVGWAIIDYIQNGRPKIESPFLFLTHIPPFKEYSSDNHLYATVKKYMIAACIPEGAGLKRGMHSLRHTLANRMLENYEPLSTISAALGHRSPDSASIYLKTDLEYLRECTLVPSEVGL